MAADDEERREEEAGEIGAGNEDRLEGDERGWRAESERDVGRASLVQPLRVQSSNQYQRALSRRRPRDSRELVSDAKTRGTGRFRPPSSR